MTLIWKNNESVNQIKTVIKGKPPRAFVDKAEKWCERNNAETVGNKKNVDKHLSKPPAKFLINFLQANHLKQFDRNQLLNALENVYPNTKNLTDGTLQNKILSLLVCKGIIKKDKIEFTNKKGEVKPKMIYSVNEFPQECPYLSSKKNCEYNWKVARTTKYFSQEGE